MEAQIAERLSRLVPGGALQIGALVNHAELVKESASLRDECRVAQVVRGLDVISQRSVQLPDGLSDGQGHVAVLFMVAAGSRLYFVEP